MADNSENYTVFGKETLFNELATFVKNITVYGTFDANHILLKYLRSEEWVEKNPVLLSGEVGIESDTTKFKFGDGKTFWNDLAYIVTGVSVSDDTTTNATRYILFDDITSGTSLTVNVSSTKLTFNPSTGHLTAVNFDMVSDQNLKENIEPLKNSLDSIEVIEKINPVKFTWKDTGEISYGVIAQEIEKILPDLVKTDNNHKSVSYISLISFIIDAMKKQQNKILDLEGKIQTLSNNIQKFNEETP